MDTTKLTAFAQAVGVDIKELKQLLNGKIDNATVTQLIEQAKTAVKAEILGDGVPENLDTLKEKLADLGRRIDEFANLDLVATYNAAKA